MHKNYAESSINCLQGTMLVTWLKLVLVSPSYRWEMKLREVNWLAWNYVARKWGARLFKPKSVWCPSLYILPDSLFPQGIKSKLLSLAFRTLCDLTPNFLQLLLTFIHPTFLLECCSLHTLFAFCSSVCSHSYHALCLCYPSHTSLEVQIPTTFQAQFKLPSWIP